MRLKVRILVALPGILTARLVLGRRGLLQGLGLASLERVLRPPRPRVWRLLTAPLPSRGFAWRGVAWAAFQSPMASSRRAGSSPVLLVSGSGPVSSTRFGALLYWSASAWFLPLG